jgi:hypothetical protein
MAPVPLSDERAERRALLEEKRAARRAAKEERDKEQAAEEALNLSKKQSSSTAAGESATNGDTDFDNTHSDLLALPEVALQLIYSMLPAAALGRLILTCKPLCELLPEARVPYLLARLNTPTHVAEGRVGYTHILSNPTDAREAIEQSLSAGGDTGRILPKKATKFSKATSNEFISYARFLEQAVSGYGYLDTGNSNNQIMLPRHVNGRFASVSPEHSLCRMGGDGLKTGAGGSGVASWGVGKRGQLGHGKRQDEREPRMLLSGLGYGIRIVQVSAGGGLVRVAHSLLLTSTGRVLSFGTGHSGALGFGYDRAKQLPDVLRPQYLDSLAGVRMVCVAAGELHSASVSQDGDVYTWGDGFCGQVGHGDKRPQLTPRQVTQGGLEDEVVSSISCGSRHTLAVTEDGLVFSWGLGHFGVLGRSFTPFDYDADAAVENLMGGEGGGDAHAVVNVMGGEGDDDGDGEPELGDVVRSLIAQEVHPLADEHPLAGDRSRADQLADENYAAELRAHLDLIANVSLNDSSDQCKCLSIYVPDSRYLYKDYSHGTCACLSCCSYLIPFLSLTSFFVITGVPKLIDSLQGIKIVGSSAGHRHSLLLDEHGNVYSFGAGNSGCLGHGDTLSQMYPMRIADFVDYNIRIMQISAGVDMSMAVDTKGNVYAWGKTDGGRIGLGMSKLQVTLPRRVSVTNPEGAPVKCVDVECGYVHSVIVGLDGTLHMCGKFKSRS